MNFSVETDSQVFLRTERCVETGAPAVKWRGRLRFDSNGLSGVRVLAGWAEGVTPIRFSGECWHPSHGLIVDYRQWSGGEETAAAEFRIERKEVL